jgi:hypothetical protein
VQLEAFQQEVKQRAQLVLLESFVQAQLTPLVLSKPLARQALTRVGVQINV